MTVSPRDKVVLAVVLALVAVFGFYKFAIVPQHKTAADLDAQITTQQTALTTAEQQYAKGKAAQSLVRTSGPAVAAAQRAVPESSDIPALLRLLQSSSDQAGVSLQSITLSGGGDGTTAPAVATSTPAATAIPVTLSFSGGYAALDRLVDHLDGLVTIDHHGLTAKGPLIAISAVSLSPSGSSTTGGSSKLIVQLTASIYQRAAASTALGASTEGTS